MARIEQHVTRDVVAIDGGVTCTEAAKIMSERKIGAVAVLEKGRTVGLVTERDLVVRVLADGLTGASPVRDAMRRDIPTVTPTSSEAECSHVMRDHYTRHLLVSEGERITGIISMRDVIRLMLEEKQTLIDQLQSFIYDQR